MIVFALLSSQSLRVGERFPFPSRKEYRVGLLVVVSSLS